MRQELVSTLDLTPTFLAAAGAESVSNLPGSSLEPLLLTEAVSWRKHLFTEYHVHSNHNYYPQRAVRDERYKLTWDLQPDQPNSGYEFTIDRFVGQQEMQLALDEASSQVRKAYAQMRQPPEFELYDLEHDPFEFHSIAGDSGHQEILEELKKVLLEWRQKTADPFLGTVSVMRLKAEIDATFINGQYQRPGSREYPDYLVPQGAN